MFSRGFITAALLIVIALASIAVARRLEREYRLLAKLRAGAATAGISDHELSEEERDTAHDLAAAGVLRGRDGRHYLDPGAAANFRGKRLRLAVGGALGALLFAVTLAFLLLRR